MKSNKKIILESFKELGFKPRDGQDDVVEEIIAHYLTGKQTVILDAPTGSGKSIIGMVTAVSLDKILEKSQGSIIVTGTNFLLKQYDDDHHGKPYFHKIIGADNYGCALRVKMKHKETTAKDCYQKSKYFYSTFGENFVPDECKVCEFAESRKLKNKKKITTTNYAYYFLDRLYIDRVTKGVDPQPSFGRKTLTVFDEAHAINEIFSNVYTVFFSKSRYNEYMSDLEFLTGKDSHSVRAYSKSLGIVLDATEKNMVRPSNAGSYLKILLKFYDFVKTIIDKKASWSDNEKDYDSFKLLFKKYEGLFCRTEDLMIYGIHVTTDCKKDPVELTIKPIFIGELSKEILSKTDHVLLMSATVTPSFLEETMLLENTGFVRAPYVFEEDDKTIVMEKDSMIKMNFHTLKESSTYKKAVALISRYCGYHRFENGILVVSSFKQGKLLHDFLVKKIPHKIIEHSQGTPLASAIRRFQQSEGPTLLISPSIHEGVDLPGDLSKFQIIFKAPFASLADQRMKHIMYNYRAVFNMMTVMKLVQSLGRSTRFKGDRSVTYFIDSNAARCFRSKYNIWKSQFEIIDKI